MLKRILYVYVPVIILCVSTSSYAATCKKTCTHVATAIENKSVSCDPYNSGDSDNCTFYNTNNCCNFGNCTCPRNENKDH